MCKILGYNPNTLPQHTLRKKFQKFIWKKKKSYENMKDPEQPKQSYARRAILEIPQY
jgi:hypothetical protein